jgi:hypothetical protein
MAPNVTLLDLVTVVSEHARSEAEVVAAVVYLVNSGAVRLCGNFKGARFDTGTPGGLASMSPWSAAARSISPLDIVEIARMMEAKRLARAHPRR